MVEGHSCGTGYLAEASLCNRGYMKRVYGEGGLGLGLDVYRRG